MYTAMFAMMISPTHFVIMAGKATRPARYIEAMAGKIEQLQNPLGLLRVGYANPLLKVQARRWSGGTVVDHSEQIVEETPVVIVYNAIPHVVMMATPANLEDFVLGFSVTEELIRAPSDLHAVSVVRYGQGIEVQATVDEACEAVVASRARRLSGRTGCGICGTDSIDAVMKSPHSVRAGRPVRPAAIEAALAALAARQELNALSGAVHAAAWVRVDGTVDEVREDVGRHNALDKLIGALLRRGADPETGFILVTSRASFEMVQKAAVFGAPLLAAISGPTGLAVRVAEQSGMTLVGFARGDRLTVYTHPERVAT
jgi:formate dehydrogenase accessory protein FdhD